jgi:hypothetical protein
MDPLDPIEILFQKVLPNFSTKFQHHNFQQRRVDDNSHDNLLVSFVPNVSTAYVRTATCGTTAGPNPDTEQQQPQIKKTTLKNVRSQAEINNLPSVIGSKD